MRRGRSSNSRFPWSDSIRSRVIAGRRTTVGFGNTGRSWVSKTVAASGLLQDLWDEKEAATLERQPLELLRYRSNLLGADLRITNFGGGNTSSKFDLIDPVSGRPARVLAVKGSGGDLRSIRALGLCAAVHGQARAAHRSLSRRSARRRDGRRTTRSARSATTAWRPRSTPRCMRFCRSTTSITCIPTGRLRSPPARTATEDRGVQPPLRASHHLGAVAAARLRAGADAAARC